MWAPGLITMWQGKESGKQSPGLGKGQERVRFFTAVSCPHPFHILLRAQETGIAAFNKKKKGRSWCTFYATAASGGSVATVPASCKAEAAMKDPDRHNLCFPVLCFYLTDASIIANEHISPRLECTKSFVPGQMSRLHRPWSQTLLQVDKRNEATLLPVSLQALRCPGAHLH